MCELQGISIQQTLCLNTLNGMHSSKRGMNRFVDQ